MSRGKRILLILALCVLMALILLAIAEAVVRVRAWIKYGEAGPRIEDTYRIDETTGLRLPRPGYSSSRLTINSHGFRGPEIEHEKPQGTYRIAFLGGSTTYCAEVSGDQKTWPYLTVKALEEAFPERRFDYINSGVPGFTTRESLKRFESEVRAFSPDLVVIYHSTNDLSGNSRVVAAGQGVDSAATEQNLTWFSRWSLFSYLVEKNLWILMLQQAAEKTENKLDMDPSALAAPFEANLRRLVKGVKASGADVALTTFSTRIREDQTAKERSAAAATALYYMPFFTPGALLESFSAYNRTIRLVAKEEQTILIEAETAIPGDAQHFVDSVHFNDNGAEKMSRVVSHSLKVGLEERKP